MFQASTRGIHPRGTALPACRAALLSVGASTRMFEEELEDERRRVDLCRGVPEAPLELGYGFARPGVAAAVDHVQDRVGPAVPPGPSTDLGRHPFLDRPRIAAVVRGPCSHRRVDAMMLRQPLGHVTL